MQIFLSLQMMCPETNILSPSVKHSLRAVCIPGEAAISLGISNQHVYSCGLHIPVPVGYEFLFTIRGCSAHLRLQTFIADSTEDPRDNIPGSSVRLPLESLVLTFKEAQ